MNTGSLIKSILKKKGKKQSWLATQLGISQPALSQMLKNDLKFSLVIRICEILEITIADILEECNKKKKTLPSDQEPQCLLKTEI